MVSPISLVEFLEQNLKNLTKQFINNFINEYRKVDKKSTDSYIIDYVLPDVLSGTLSVDLNNQFYYPLMSDGLVSNLIKAEYNKNIRDLYPILKNVFRQGNTKNIDFEAYKLIFVSENEYEFDEFECVNGKHVLLSKTAKSETYKIISTTNRFQVVISIFFDEGKKELRKITVASDNKIRSNLGFPYFEIRVNPTYINDVLQYKLSSTFMGCGDDNILDINPFWTAIQIINQYITDGEE